jgi:hypothetical protein
MMDWVSQIVTWVNVLANTLGKVLLAPAAFLPGWLSNTLVSIVTGTAVLFVFKYTSNQKAIAKTKNGIKANLLAIWLFKESVRVILQAEIQILKGCLCLIFHSLRPMSVMLIPVSLLLAQMGLWYQHRPLLRDEETVVTLELNDSVAQSWPVVTLKPNEAIDVLLGPLRVTSRGELCWAIKAREPGCHDLTFSVNGVECTKKLAIGPGFMCVSPVRPDRHWAHMLQHPSEPPMTPDALIQSISIDYPERTSWGASTDSWLIFFFVVTTLFAWVAGPFLKVKF